jgi:hypothetical protein
VHIEKLELALGHKQGKILDFVLKKHELPAKVISKDEKE